MHFVPINFFGETRLDFFAGLLFAGFAVAGIALHYYRCRIILNLWVRRNDYTILEAEIRFFNVGPFLLRTLNHQQVYRVTVRNGAGALRKGWVRCGGFGFGILSNRADAEWDDV